MGVRIGISSNDSFLTIIKNKWGKPISITAGIGIFMITASFQAGNTIGASLAFAELFNTSVFPWIIILTSAAIFLLFFRSFYRILEKIMIILVGIMLTSFIITFMLAKPDIGSLFRGLRPTLPSGSASLSIALIASSFSIVGAFYQSYLVREKGWSKGQVKKGTREGITGILILGIISSLILVNAATILHPLGIKVNSAADMGLALTPLYGKTATIIFMLGLFGASFSSLLGNATIGGSLLSDAFSLGNQLDKKTVRFMIILVMLFGAGISLKFGGVPLELIVFAQGITVIIAPLIGILFLLIANDNNTLGKLKNNLWRNIVASAGIILLIFLAYNNLHLIFFIH